MTSKNKGKSTLDNDNVNLQQSIKQISAIIRKHNFSHSDTALIFSEVRKQCGLKAEPKRKTKMPVLLSDLDVERLLKGSESNHTHWTIIQALLTTGCRVSELINISIEDIYWDELKILIKAGKTGDRYILFPEFLTVHFRTLANGKRPEQKLFTSRQYKPFTRFGINKMLDKYAIKLGLQKSIHPHIFRHMYCTKLSGVMNESEVMILSGHAKKETLAIYQHLSVDKLADKYRTAFSR